MIRVLIAIGGLLACTGCYYDTGSLLRAPDSCQVDSVSFAFQVLPLLDRHCNGCHGASTAFGGVVLDTYPQVKEYVDQGSLLGSIQHLGDYSAMPPDSEQLPACDILTVATWIEAGAGEN